MGTGSDEFANQLRNAAGRYHGKVVAHIGFTPELEHKIIAGDLCLRLCVRSGLSKTGDCTLRQGASAEV